MEKDKTIKIYTIIFIVIISGFIGFLFFQGSKDNDRNERIKGRVNSGIIK
jgi:uncharacterized membrane protein